jgi:hypothetical protein
VTQDSLLTDAVVRRLIGVGQVDIVVGVPTMNHVDTISGVLDVVDQGLVRSFPRARTVVIAADGGSDDGTLDAVEASVSRSGTSGGLRTRHRLGAAYRGGPGRAGALRLIFTAADLLQAKAVAVVDPDDSGLRPDSIGGLLAPVFTGDFDVVGGLRERDPLQGLLVTQLIRPLMRAGYGRYFEQPLVGAYACSHRFAAGALAARDVWDRSPMREGIDVWLTAEALSGEYCVAQTWLGPSESRARHPRSLHDVFGPLIAALFARLEEADGARETARPQVATVGPRRTPAAADRPAPGASGIGATFASDVRDLRLVLERILTADTLAVLAKRADDFEHGVMRYDDDLWVSTVYEFVTAHHAGVMDRGHVVQALMPLYRGRAAAFVSAHASTTAADTEEHLDRLGRRFEERRQELNRPPSPTLRTP